MDNNWTHIRVFEDGTFHYVSRKPSPNEKVGGRKVEDMPIHWTTKESAKDSAWFGIINPPKKDSISAVIHRDAVPPDGMLLSDRVSQKMQKEGRCGPTVYPPKTTKSITHVDEVTNSTDSSIKVKLSPTNG